MATLCFGRPKRAVILGASVAVSICIGTSYSFSVFAQPLAELHGWSLSQVMVAFSICAGISPLPMILGGRLLDLAKARLAIVAGGLLFACCFFCSGSVSSLPMLYLLYGLGCGMGLSTAYSALIGNSIKLYPAKKGLASGLVTAAYGSSAVLMAPLANAIIQSWGVQAAFRCLGLAFLVVVGGAAFLIRDASAVLVGEAVADSMESTSVQTVSASPQAPVAAKAAADSADMTWRQMVCTRRFYGLTLLFVCGTMAGLMLVSNTSVVAQTMFGLTPAIAALAVSAYALCNCLGRFLFGLISDQLGRYPAVLLICIMLALVLGVVVLWPTVAAFLLVLAGVGLGFGGVMGIFPSMVAESFGLPHCGTNYGVVFIGYSLGALLGPRVAVFVLEHSAGDFTNAFLLAMLFSLVGVALAALLLWQEKRALFEKNAE